MPYIHTQMSLPLSKEGEDKLTRAFGEAVTLLGKSENWLMLRFEDGCRMAFRGKNDAPMCFIGVSMYGNSSSEAADRMTAALTRAVHEETGIQPDHVYVRYMSTEAWGWNGSNF